MVCHAYEANPPFRAPYEPWNFANAFSIRIAQSSPPLGRMKSAEYVPALLVCAGNESSTVTSSHRSFRPHHSRTVYFPRSFASVLRKQFRTALGYSAKPAMAPTSQQSPSEP